MIKKKLTKYGYIFVDENDKPTMEDYFLDEVVETKDIEGFYLCKNIWGEHVLISGEGNLVYEFSKKDQPTGVFSLIDKILKHLDLLKNVKSLDFFANKSVKDVLFFKLNSNFENNFSKAIKNNDNKTANGLQILHEQEVDYLNSAFEKGERQYNSKKQMKERRAKMIENAKKRTAERRLADRDKG